MDGGLRVDGYCIDDGTGAPLVLEYCGCAYHGCPTCFPLRDARALNGCTMEDNYQSTLARLSLIRERVRVIVVWECEVRRQLTVDEEMRRYYDTCQIVAPLDPREDALFGGRVQPTILHYHCRDNEEVKMMETVSVYPHVMARHTFAVGVPRVRTTPHTRMCYGLLKVRVLPPRDLLHPVLPLRTRHGLLFPLCRTCALEQQNAECEHSEEERSWIAAYTNDELQMAFDRGYRLLDPPYEVCVYVCVYVCAWGGPGTPPPHPPPLLLGEGGGRGGREMTIIFFADMGIRTSRGTLHRLRQHVPTSEDRSEWMARICRHRG